MLQGAVDRKYKKELALSFSNFNTHPVHFEAGFFVLKSSHGILVYYFLNSLQKAIQH